VPSPRSATAAGAKEFSMDAQEFDVAIVGAGPVGLALALSAAGAGLSTALVGPVSTARDGRTAALLEGSISLLRALGAWADLERFAAPLRVMRIVDDTDSMFRPPPATFRSSEIGRDAFGWNVENAELVTALSRRVESERGIVRFDTTVEHAMFGERAVVHLEDGASVSAALVVGTDGRRSRVRDLAGIAAHSHSYPQTAITTLIRHERGHDDTSTEFHTRSGPFTLVPLPGQRSSLVWVTNPHHAKRVMALDDHQFAAAIERQSGGILGQVTPDGPRGQVPLGLVSVESFVAPRVALAGEAAHALPPIGAQGLNLGFADVAALAGILTDAVSRGADPGSPAMLSRYDRERRPDTRVRSLAVDTLNRSLLSANGPVDAARGLGLALVSRIGPLRRAMMRAGLPGAPSAAKGL
jgi:2-octaprenyl-6-methoxyphenol hydroxylase